MCESREQWPARPRSSSCVLSLRPVLRCCVVPCSCCRRRRPCCCPLVRAPTPPKITRRTSVTHADAGMMQRSERYSTTFVAVPDVSRPTWASFRVAVEADSAVGMNASTSCTRSLTRRVLTTSSPTEHAADHRAVRPAGRRGPGRPDDTSRQGNDSLEDCPSEKEDAKEPTPALHDSNNSVLSRTANREQPASTPSVQRAARRENEEPELPGLHLLLAQCRSLMVSPRPLLLALEGAVVVSPSRCARHACVVFRVICASPCPLDWKSRGALSSQPQADRSSPLCSPHPL